MVKTPAMAESIFNFEWAVIALFPLFQGGISQFFFTFKHGTEEINQENYFERCGNRQESPKPPSYHFPVWR